MIKGLCIDDEDVSLIKRGNEYILEEDNGVWAIPVWYLPEVGQPYDKNRFVILPPMGESDPATELLSQQATT